jgi:hypothetical protein
MAVWGREAVFRRDDGTWAVPAATEWADWVAATSTRHFAEEDPLLDWLDAVGRSHGFVPDDELDGYDPRTDLRLFLLQRGIDFEAAVLELIRTRLETVRVAEGWRDARDPAQAEGTVRLMEEGVPVIEQAVLWNPEDRVYGVADLLVRSDLLDRLVPGVLSAEEAGVAAPGLGRPWHYRVVDIKFRTLELLADGHAAASLRPLALQVWLYTHALTRIQGGPPAAGYLLGRGWVQGPRRGEECFGRLARVDHGTETRHGSSLARLAVEALAWVRRLRTEGPGWRVLPRPSVPELYPHARNSEDHPWHQAKTEIATALGELTLLPGVNPTRRRAALAAGLESWRDPRVSAARLGVPPRYAAQCDAVLAVNRDAPDLVVVPPRIIHAHPAWRTPAPLELYVDFETVSNLNDDFRALPRAGGQPLIFQIGCGRWEDGQWAFAQWTVDRLRVEDEGRIIDAWLSHMADLLAKRGLQWDDVRLVHWSAAEPVQLDAAYNAARLRHPERHWPALPWFDFLQAVIRTEPVAVRGSFAFGLKAMARAMHEAGLIATTWEEGPVDGLGAMVGAWWCDAEAARRGVSMVDLDLMAEIARYNEVDCRVMAEIVAWLRANR